VAPAPPLVSVVTPVYNTAPYLRECIESVLAQTWPHLEYIVVDNHSTDGSRAIAAEYAERTGRLRLISPFRHLPQLENFNFALAQISPESAFTKVVSADDWLFPECVARLVDVAGRRKSIGVVSSLWLMDRRVVGAGLPYAESIFSGRDIARRQLRRQGFFCGSPSTVLYRSDLVRATPEFFDPRVPHADTDRAYQILRDHEFGFVHQVLSYMRMDPESISGRVEDLDPAELDYLIVLLKYGPEFLDPEEFAARRRRYERIYCRTYLRQSLGAHRRRFLAYHRQGRSAIGHRFPVTVAARAVLAELADLVLNPKRTAGRLVDRMRSRRPPP